MSIPITLSWGTLPPGYCMTTFRQLAIDILSQLQGTLPGSFTGILVQEDAPGPSDQDKVWIKVNGSNQPIGIFIYAGGLWLWPHYPISPYERRIWKCTASSVESDVWSYDGGDGTDPTDIAHPPTPASGAMWQVDHDMDFLIPMGAGTSGTTYNDAVATVLSPGSTLGEEQHTLTPDEVHHQHAFGRVAYTSGVTGFRQMAVETGDISFSANAAGNIGRGGYGDPGTDTMTPIGPTADMAGIPTGDHAITDIPRASIQTNPSYITLGTNASAHQNLPPVIGIWFIQCTGRQFYTP